MQDMSITSTVAENIRGFRKKLGYSQYDLAELSGLHHTYIGNLERSESNVTLLNVERIANALKVPTHYLLIKDSYKTESSGSTTILKHGNKKKEDQQTLTAFVVSGLEIRAGAKRNQKEYINAIERELYSSTGISLRRLTKTLGRKPFMLLMEETGSRSKKPKK